MVEKSVKNYIEWCSRSTKRLGLGRRYDDIMILYTVYTVYSVYTVDSVSTVYVYTVYTVYTGYQRLK